MKGWEKKYSEILKEFKYSRKKDREAARVLNSILKRKFPIKKLEEKIKNQTVFVMGAGPSLISCMPILRKYKKITKIVADGATKALLENKIRPDVIVTDLDGEQKSLKKAGRYDTIMVVHSHGDNIKKLPVAANFKFCIGTTEDKPFGKIHNFGGFTDGDRCVFLARYFGAKNIILFGMDFGTKIGKYSKPTAYNKATKIRKLRWAKNLLEWIASQGNSRFYTTSKSIKGFNKIRFAGVDKIITS